MPKNDPYAGVWEEHMRVNSGKKDYGLEDEKKPGPTGKVMSLPLQPPNMPYEDFPDDPISPAFDPGLQANFRDKHNNYSREEIGSWKKAPEPVGPPEPPLNIPETLKEMKEYWPFKNDKIGEYEAAAGISIDMDRHEDLRLADFKKQDEERWGNHSQNMADTYLRNGEQIKEWGERCGIWSCCEPTEAEEGYGQLIAGERGMHGFPRPSPECNLGLKSREEAEAEQERRRIWRKNNWSQEPNGE